MVRNYKRKPGSRKYQDYSKEKLQKALRELQKGKSQLYVSKKYGIPRSTLQNKLKGTHCNVPGHPTILTSIEEELVAKTLKVVSEWGFPLTGKDVAEVVSKFLTKQGRVVKTWRNNVPGEDFIKRFAKRNKLTFRLASNIKKSRASVGENEVEQFFQNIRHVIEEAEPRNIFNYDETNITDDPGAKKVLVSKGVKRIERVQEHSKTSVSLMVCGNADGNILPPMVVYKSKNVYKNWTIGGPAGTEYANSSTGWFDMSIFEQWFTKILLPYIQKNTDKSSKKIVIGDNLASHFSTTVVQLAQENQIYFTSLPPNSTHFLQPLDVSVFGPMKKIWRGILDQWRKESRKSGSIPKDHFPILLSKLWKELLERKQNLVSGFKTTGLSPFNLNAALSKLPTTKNTERILDESLLEFLKESRGYRKESKSVTHGRGRKIIARPGEEMHIIETEDLSAENIEIQAGPSGTQKKQDDDNNCTICNIEWENYAGKIDWICCCRCQKWVCGFCNENSKDLYYECVKCEASD